MKKTLLFGVIAIAVAMSFNVFGAVGSQSKYGYAFLWKKDKKGEPSDVIKIDGLARCDYGIASQKNGCVYILREKLTSHKPVQKIAEGLAKTKQGEDVFNQHKNLQDEWRKAEINKAIKQYLQDKILTVSTENKSSKKDNDIVYKAIWTEEGLKETT